MASKVEMCNTGLILVGADPINAITDSTREGKVCAAVYDRTRNTLLAEHPWRFAHNQVALARLVDTPEFDSEYKYAFQLPPGFGRVTKIENGIPFDILGDKLLCNATSVSIEYSFVPDETKFPEWFARFLELRLARLFTIGLTDDEAKESKIEKQEREAGVQARNINSQSVINKSVDSATLVDVRM